MIDDGAQALQLAADDSLGDVSTDVELIATKAARGKGITKAKAKGGAKKRKSTKATAKEAAP